MEEKSPHDLRDPPKYLTLKTFKLIKKPEKLIIKNEEHNETLTYSKNYSVSQLPIRKSKKPQKWSENDTDWFYTCMEIFGQDFQRIRSILSHKTLRQVLRKFKKEKKRNPLKVEQALRSYEATVITFDPKKTVNIVDNVLNQSDDSEALSVNLSDKSLEEVVNLKLKLLAENEWYQNGFDGKETELMPLEYYLRE